MKQALTALLTKVESKVDMTLKLTFNTQELGDDAGKILNLANRQLWLVLSTEDNITEKDIPEAPPEGYDEDDFGGKSPSKRLRDVLYRVWEQKGKPGGSFELYYRVQMEKLIDTQKEKLL